jgi:hypothetical protein
VIRVFDPALGDALCPGPVLVDAQDGALREGVGEEEAFARVRQLVVHMNIEVAIVNAVGV